MPFDESEIEGSLRKRHIPLKAMSPDEGFFNNSDKVGKCNVPCGRVMYARFPPRGDPFPTVAVTDFHPQQNPARANPDGVSYFQGEKPFYFLISCRSSP